MVKSSQQESLTTVIMPFVDEVTQPLQRVLKSLNNQVIGKPKTWNWSLQRHVKIGRVETMNQE